MEKQIKPLVYPDRVLSLVVLFLSIFMILGSAYISYAQIMIQDYTTRVQKNSNAKVAELVFTRQQVLGATDEEDEGSLDGSEEIEAE